MRRILWLVTLQLLLVPLFVGCSTERQLTSEELATIERLRTELEGLDAELTGAEAELDLYAGGLVKTLIQARVEILRTTQSLIEQRIHAIESGAPVAVVLAVAEPDTARAAKLSREIAKLDKEIAASRAEANRYSGGLVQAMALSTVATKEQTRAMLQQDRLCSQYGLVLRLPSLAEESSAAVAPDVGASAVPPTRSEPADVFKIVDVDARVTESNSTWWKFAWKLTVKNLTDEVIGLNATIEFKDADGFVVDDDSEYGLRLDPNEERTFTGYDLVTAGVAGNVSQIGAKVSRSR